MVAFDGDYYEYTGDDKKLSIINITDDNNCPELKIVKFNKNK